MRKIFAAISAAALSAGLLAAGTLSASAATGIPATVEGRTMLLVQGPITPGPLYLSTGQKLNVVAEYPGPGDTLVIVTGLPSYVGTFITVSQ